MYTFLLSNIEIQYRLMTIARMVEQFFLRVSLVFRGDLFFRPFMPIIEFILLCQKQRGFSPVRAQFVRAEAWMPRLGRGNKARKGEFPS